MKIKYFIIFIISLFFMLPAFCGDNLIFSSERGKVLSVKYVDTDGVVAQTKQVAKVKLLTGEFKGQTVELDNVMTGNPYYDIELKQGMKVLLHAETDEFGGVEYSVEDINRAGSLVWLSLIFSALLIYVGRKKGVCSLVSILLTILLITHCLSPMILLGLNPVISTIIICIISTAVTMYLVGGFNAKSTSALIGAVLSLLFAAILSAVIMFTAHLTGFSAENSTFLYSTHPELNFIELMISMMVLATLGAVMDVAMSISSTINELYITDNQLGIIQLFKSGMNVGRDIIGTMANTLILVYLGGSLPLVLLADNIDLQKFINLNQVVTEISSALIGSVAIVISVPFTAIAASILIRKYAKKAETVQLPFSSEM